MYPSITDFHSPSSLSIKMWVVGGGGGGRVEKHHGEEQINPLSPGVKLQILLLCFHTFRTEAVGRSC